jgi:hypothetical protein
MPAGKRWLAAPPQTSGMESLPPAELVRFLANAPGVKRVGQDTIRGRVATHYRGTIDPRTLGDKVGGTTKKVIEAALGGRDVPLGIEAWVGANGLSVCLCTHISINGTTADSVEDILAYGVKVDVQAPPKSQVISIRDFQKAMTSGDTA